MDRGKNTGNVSINMLVTIVVNNNAGAPPRRLHLLKYGRRQLAQLLSRRSFVESENGIIK